MTRAQAIKFALSRGADADRRREIRRIYNKGHKMTSNDHLQAVYDARMVENLVYRSPSAFLQVVGT